MKLKYKAGESNCNDMAIWFFSMNLFLTIASTITTDILSCSYMYMFHWIQLSNSRRIHLPSTSLSFPANTMLTGIQLSYPGTEGLHAWRTSLSNPWRTILSWIPLSYPGRIILIRIPLTKHINTWLSFFLSKVHHLSATLLTRRTVVAKPYKRKNMKDKQRDKETFCVLLYED